MSEQNESPGAARRALLQVALVLLPVLAFAPGLTSPLTHYDDPLYLDRPELTVPGFQGLAALWSGEAQLAKRFLEFFPLRDSVYWLLVQLWGKAPLPFHLASLALHVLATLLTFRFVLRLGQRRWVAAAVALLFAVHPIHIESVTWAAGLKDPLYTCFLLGSVLAWLRFREHQRPIDYAWFLALLVCGLWVKSMMLSTFLIVLALERLIGAPTEWKTIVRRLVAPGLICALFLAQFVGLARYVGVNTELHQGNLLAHVVLVGWAQVLYLRQLFFPASFRLIYCFAPVDSWLDARLFAGLGLVIAVVLAVRWWRQHALRLFCLAFYFACLLPVANLLPFPAVMADRYLYAASIGALLLVATLLEPVRARVRNLVLGATVIALLFTTALRTSIWQDEELLWEEADEDPLCMEDPDFPASDTHYLRFLSAHDDETRLAALKRVIARGRIGIIVRCEALVNGAPLLEASGDHATAVEWMRLAIAECQAAKPHQLSRAVLLVSMHRDLPLAAEAAERWYRLTPSPSTNLFRLLTQLELQGPPASPELVPLVQSAPNETCGLLAEWSNEVNQTLRASVADALRACAQ